MKYLGYGFGTIAYLIAMYGLMISTHGRGIYLYLAFVLNVVFALICIGLNYLSKE